jgi:hypothetical protein
MHVSSDPHKKMILRKIPAEALKMSSSIQNQFILEAFNTARPVSENAQTNRHVFCTDAVSPNLVASGTCSHM